MVTARTQQPAASPGANRAQSGQSRGRPRRKSRYGTQLEEKKSLKVMYGIRERQLKRYFTEARNAPEKTGLQMAQLLELRLDNAVFRTGLAATRRQARQMVSHRLFAVNGRPVDIPSLRLKIGDVVTVRENKREKSHFTNFEKRLQNAQVPEWIKLEVANWGFSIVSKPDQAEEKIGVDIQSVVELLAR